MRRIDINIDSIKIDGKPEALYEVVTKLDKRVEDFTNETNEIKRVLFKYVKSNAGKQYQEATTSIHNFTSVLYEASNIVNYWQNQICKFVEKVCDYDIRSVKGYTPRKPHIEIVKAPVDAFRVEFNAAEMTDLLNKIRDYVYKSNHTTLQITSDKDEMGAIWKDIQYRVVSNEIDDLVSTIRKAVKKLEEYADFLQSSLKKLK